MSIAFTDWIIEEQEKDERIDLKDHTKNLFRGRGWKVPEDAVCVNCGDFAQDSHHYRNRAMGGSKKHDTSLSIMP
jgi:hypothetical protein